MSTVTEALLNMYEKHKAYLEEQIAKEMILDNKYNKFVPYDNEHLHKANAYELALDNIKTLFGEKPRT